MSRGALPQSVPPPDPVRDYVNAALAKVLSLFLQDHCERVALEHRLAYQYDDTDTDPSGKVTKLFVCKCDLALERRKFNEHIKASYKEMG